MICWKSEHGVEAGLGVCFFMHSGHKSTSQIFGPFSLSPVSLGWVAGFLQFHSLFYGSHANGKSTCRNRSDTAGPGTISSRHDGWKHFTHVYYLLMYGWMGRTNGRKDEHSVLRNLAMGKGGSHVIVSKLCIYTTTHDDIVFCTTIPYMLDNVLSSDTTAYGWAPTIAVKGGCRGKDLWYHRLSCGWHTLRCVLEIRQDFTCATCKQPN